MLPLAQVLFELKWLNVNIVRFVTIEITINIVTDDFQLDLVDLERQKRNPFNLIKPQSWPLVS